MMKKRILLGVDASLSSATQQAIHMISELVASTTTTTSAFHLVLLNVIPATQVTAIHPGFYTGQIETLVPSNRQQKQAEEIVHKARLLLQKQGLALEDTEGIVRVGVPADEIVKVANEQYVHMIVLGSRGNSFNQHLRHLVFGSTTQQVQRTAPCPVLIVLSPKSASPRDPVIWYEEAIKRYLRHYPQALTVLTPQLVVQKFALPRRKPPGLKEIEAAAKALGQLEQRGMLFRREIQGKVCYIND
ncbi:MAG TPA: universal stress protein [Ktedonobacteraceae bacterium]